MLLSPAGTTEKIVFIEELILTGEGSFEKRK